MGGSEVWQIVAVGCFACVAACSAPLTGSNVEPTGKSAAASEPETSPGAPARRATTASSAPSAAEGEARSEAWAGERGAARSSAGPALSPRPAPRPDDADVAEARPERFGLATVWGETLTSRVRDVTFERESESPFATGALYYNDADGISAMLDRAGADAMPLVDGRFRVRLLNERGESLPTLQQRGRWYTIGQEGRRYTIEVSNGSAEPVEVVATVDGLDVIDGEPGSFDKRGYVLGAWSSLVIDGFRRSQDAVAAFRFGKVPDSYAARKGNDRHVGVVGVALFRQRGARQRWLDDEVELRHSADPFPGRFAEPPPSR